MRGVVVRAQGVDTATAPFFCSRAMVTWRVSYHSTMLASWRCGQLPSACSFLMGCYSAVDMFLGVWVRQCDSVVGLYLAKSEVQMKTRAMCEMLQACGFKDSKRAYVGVIMMNRTA